MSIPGIGKTATVGRDTNAACHDAAAAIAKLYDSLRFGGMPYDAIAQEHEFIETFSEALTQALVNVTPHSAIPQVIAMAMTRGIAAAAKEERRRSDERYEAAVMRRVKEAS